MRAAAVMLVVASASAITPAFARPVSDTVDLTTTDIAVVDATDGTIAEAAAEPSASKDPEPPQALAYRQLAGDIAALIDGTFDYARDVGTLFDIDPLDESQVQPEISRLRLLLEREPTLDLTETTATWSDDTQSATISATATTSTASDATVEIAADTTSETTTPMLALAVEYEPIAAARRLLDQARLGFYLLSNSKRRELISAHEVQRDTHRQQQSQQAVDDAEKKALEAKAATQAALEAAQRARSEVERLISQERARLLGISGRYADFEVDLARKRQKLEARSEETLAYHRRVREAVEQAQDPVLVDQLYSSLRRWLWDARSQLADAISSLSAGTQALEEPESSQLDAIDTFEDGQEIAEKLAELRAARAQLLASEQEYLRNAARQFYGEVESLNRDRLTLLPRLSQDKRDALFGLESAGFEQAGAELRQISLTLSYHLIALKDWLFAVQVSDQERDRTTLGAGTVVLKWLLLTLLFIYWRKRSEPIVRKWMAGVRLEHRQRHGGQASAYETLAHTIYRTHGSLAWFAYWWVFLWSIPRSDTTALEIELVTTAMVWIFGGSILVSVIDTLSNTDIRMQNDAERKQVAALRLRSLRLVSRTVVTFGVILALSAKLVGQGTIYSWVWTTCWLAVVPIVLVLVRWWRDEAFRRVQGIRKKSALATWIVAHERGWRSFPAAVLAAFSLFLTSFVRRTRIWVSRYDVTRRALAYFFRRGLDRMAQERPAMAETHIPDGVFRELGPEVCSATTIACSSDMQVVEVVQRVKRVGGGVFAIVGERGIGKTTTLRQVEQRYEKAILVDCPPDGLAALTQAIAKRLGLPPTTSLTECGKHLDEGDSERAILIDNAHRLIRPTMGGLAAFDEFFVAARNFSHDCCWVLALDHVIWRFLERSRGSKPRFDEVIALPGWREEEVAALLIARCRQVGITVNFDHLLDRLPKDPDEIDIAEAVDRTSVGYYRLLWDYSAGNPGVALHMWRRSLGLDVTGKIQVKVFQAPDTRELEKLTDPAVLVMRSVIQLGPARVEDLVAATMQRPSQIQDTLRYGLARGYFDEQNGRYRVSWGWYRAITRFLQRRHLLAQDV